MTKTLLLNSLAFFKSTFAAPLTNMDHETTTPLMHLFDSKVSSRQFLRQNEVKFALFWNQMNELGASRCIHFNWSNKILPHLGWFWHYWKIWEHFIIHNFQNKPNFTSSRHTDWLWIVCAKTATSSRSAGFCLQPSFELMWRPKTKKVPFLFCCYLVKLDNSVINSN